MKHNLIIIFILALTTIGCQSNYFQLETTEEYNEFQGKKLVWEEDSIATTLMNFEKQQDGSFEFYTEITNNSTEPIIIDPANFRFFITESKKVLRDSLRIAINPEEEIQRITLDMADTEDSKDAETGLSVFFALVSTVANVASDAPANKVVDDIAFWGTNAVAAQVEKKYEIENLEHRREYWENNVLRKTKLFPGEDFGGRFYIPLERNALKIVVMIPIDNKVVHEFEFEQIKLD